MERTVYVYLVTGNEKSCLIDTGVNPSMKDVLDFIESAGKKPDEILLTHSHVDHIGSLYELKEHFACPAAASELSSAWIEDVDEQFRQRPVPNFRDFVKKSAKIERKLKDGDLTLLGGSTLAAYEAPGHDKGQLVFYHREDGVLFAADAVPIPGEMPVYDDVSAQLETLNRMRGIEGTKVLLMSWADPCYGGEKISQVFDDAVSYVKEIHRLTLEGISKCGGDEEAVAKYVHGALKLPESTFTKMFIGTVKAHLREKDLAV
jgi:hypothetical protein